MLMIKDLRAKVGDREILKGVTLNVKAGEVHAVMGPNGSGKSTLAKALAGDANVEVTGGSVLFEGGDLLRWPPEERALRGVFMAFQYPVEIPGVNNESFLRMAYNAKRKFEKKEEMDPLEFHEFLMKKLKHISLKEDFLGRSVNHGFSGGEKKQNEILQMVLLEPKFTILDETDSGLDIDALRSVSASVNQFRKPDNAIVLVTHYQRLLTYVEPDFVHVLADGKIVRSGGKELAHMLEKVGYEGLGRES